ncbi:MAG: hypothetical protein JO372_25725 [Solirubrobacterales bacterium]|nr:hypothetical protein [Solirubrobacterales bacterium]
MKIEQLEPLVGEWSMEAAFPDAPQGRTVFEWLPGNTFLVQRWEVPHPEAPDGIAIIGIERERDGYLQHYFDSRGVSRLYRMSFENGLWSLWRTTPDFSPLDFWQRFTGRLGDDGNTIRGSWESSRDDGASWDHDFELTYRKVRRPT